MEDWQLGRGLNKAGRRPRGGNGRVRGKDTEVSHPVPLPPSSTFHPQPLAQLPPRPQFHSPQAQIWSSPISFGPTGPEPR